MRWLVLLGFSLAGFAFQVPLRPSDSLSNTEENTLTPSKLIELSRPGVGVANEKGDLVLVPMSKFSIKERKNHLSIWISSIESEVKPLQIPLENGGDAFWLDNRTIGHVVSGKEDIQELYAVSIEVESQSDILSTPSSPELVGTFPASSSAANFKYTSTGERLVFSSYVWPDKSLLTVEEQDEKWDNRGNSALIYDELFDRHWDHWISPKKSTLFSVKLTKDVTGKWYLDDNFISILNGTSHEVPTDSSGGKNDFDISSNSVVYTAKDPELSQAEHTRRNIYIVDILGQSKPRLLSSGIKGATADPIFSKQGDKIAWTEMEEDGYESDRAKLVIYDLHKEIQFGLTDRWDRSASEPCFSQDGENITFLAPDIARKKIFALPVPDTPSNSAADPHFNFVPVALTSTHTASGLQILPDGRILYTESSLVSPNDVYVISGLNKPDEPLRHRRITNFTDAELEGLSIRSPREFWFEGSEKRQVQGWVFLPPGFEEKDDKKWPAMLMIHGGPQGVFDDSWRGTWNPVAWAHQGYVIVQINPTGSTSFGQNFTDAITKDWGGRPFIDLKKGWDYFLNNYPQVDRERLVAAGGSFGGYAVNWIQGHPEYGFGFKALYCQDGIFDTAYSGYSTDELYFFNHDFGGKPWETKAKKTIEKFNPANFVANWSTPELISHGSKDYRLAETEAIAAFHALQQRGIPSRLIIYPDEIHGVIKPLNLLSWYFEIFRWFDQYVGAGKR